MMKWVLIVGCIVDKLIEMAGRAGSSLSSHSTDRVKAVRLSRYFQTSSSVVGGDPWTDSGWCWHPLYEKLRCGEPKAGASKNATGWWVREFENCSVCLDQRSDDYRITQGGELLAWNH